MRVNRGRAPSILNAELEDGERFARQAGSVFAPPPDGPLAAVLTGTAGADTLTGTASGDDISGLGGNDVLSGLDGNDDLYGGDDNDTLVGGTGNDLLDGGNGIDTISYENVVGVFAGVLVELANNITYNGNGADPGSDTLVSIENVIGSNLYDELNGDGGANVLSGRIGDDLLQGYGGDDTLNGDAGEDILWGGDGNDIIEGGDGDDGAPQGGGGLIYGLRGGAGDDIIRGGAGHDLALDGGAGIDLIYGGDGRDFITTTSGDTIYGDADDDTFSIFSDNGSDAEFVLVDGGSGNDSASINMQWRLSGIAIDLSLMWAGGDGTIGSGIVRNIEKLTNVEGSNFNDIIIIGDGYAAGVGIVGGGGDDNISGGGGGDSLQGNQGDDFLAGRGGNDYLWGREGDDNIDGGAGADRIIGDAGSDAINGGNGTDRVEYEGSGAGVVASLASGTGSGGFAQGDTYVSIENLLGSHFDDVLTGDRYANVLIGGLGSDTLWGGIGDDVLQGGGGNGNGGLLGPGTPDYLNVLIGGVGADTLIGGVGLDTASYVGSHAAVTVNLLTGTGSGADAQGDTLTAVENLTGSSHNDSLTGDAGANVLDGGAGSDALNGGDGIDTASWASAAAGVTVNLTTGVHTGEAAGDVMTSIEILEGSAFNDSLIGGSAVDTLHGGAGDDALEGRDGDDMLGGGMGADALNGGNGTDTADYRTGTLFYQPPGVAAVTVNLLTGLGSGGHAQGDTYVSIENIIGSGFNDTLTGNAGNNVITGDLGADTIDGGAGIDTADYSISFIGFSIGGVTVNLQTGVNTGGTAQGDVLISIENLVGTTDNDSLTGDGADNIIYGGAGHDTLNGGDGTDSLEGEAGHDTLNGGDGDDGLAGGEGNDNISGGDGTDVLDGGDGDDNLNGGAGMDNLYGGDGTDTASYAGSDTAVNVNLQTGVNTGGWAQDDSLSSIENLIGSDHGDTLAGDWLANVIDGGAGDDNLSGGDADDILIGGLGADAINGGTGSDTVSYAASNVAVRVRLFAGTAEFGHATGDMLTGVENLIGSAFNDQLAGDDFDNLIEGGAGADILGGRGGFDTLSYRSSNAAVIVNLANMTASGGHAAGDTFSSAFEAVIGSAFNDLLNGGNGNQTIEGGLGNDQMNGGNGYDTLSFRNAANGVTVNLSLTTAQVTGVGTDTITGFERLIGSAFDDTLTGDALDNVIIGGAGADAIVGGDGIDTVDYSASTDAVYARLGASVMGGPIFLGGDAQGDTMSGIENLIGTAFDDTLIGDANANRIAGGAGADVMDGGGGVDWADYSAATSFVAVSLTDQAGLFGHAQGDILLNFENLHGSAFNDILVGNAGVNVLLGGAGADIMDGEGGIDWVSYAGSGAVTVNLTTNVGAGGHANGDTYADIESVIGSSYSDRIYGSAGYNAMAGEAGNDLLDGRGGNDSLNGGAGNDRLNGGSGADTFIFANDWGADTIMDFSVSGGDIMLIDTSVFANFAAVMANTNDNGLGGTVISNGAVSITLNGVLKAQLSAGDFLFAALAPAVPTDKDGALTLPGLVEDDPLILPQDFGPSARGAVVDDIVPMDDLDPLILPAGLESKVTPDEAPVICPPGEADIAVARTEWDLAEMGLIDFDGRDPHRILLEPRGLDWIV